ncbi:hypothetical protein GOBAR_AA17078 [Gossypium barbadense]|uniref:Isopenicillin N synthase-like Fe(2+) 2OG dioxygenase domain-containing protein n=1 Tax=Gossypium barbadense TaxID=3634 RepID=A0A2P5XJS9_GOSBA|nr:hypothetical protein GOBAR_AA17078 [Gossypium barbadense]
MNGRRITKPHPSLSPTPSRIPPPTTALPSLSLSSLSPPQRYCIAGKSVYPSELVKILQELNPHLILPQRCSDEKESLPVFPAFKVSQERVKSLGINFTPLELLTCHFIGGLVLQVRTTGRFKRVKHRVLANSVKSRLSMIMNGGTMGGGDGGGEGGESSGRGRSREGRGMRWGDLG